MKVSFFTILFKSQWFHVVFNLIPSFCNGIVKLKSMVGLKLATFGHIFSYPNL
jgi:hypothetical protein